MHPLLADVRRLGIYLLAWIPLALLVMGLLAATGSFTWFQSAELVLPLVLVYAFVCLSAWYICRYIPLRGPGGGALYLLVAATPAAGIASVFWSGLVGWAVASLAGLEKPYLAERSLLFGAGVLLYYLALAFHYVLLAIENSREAQGREMQARILAREAELRSLKAQINPHFLFNCLHSISSLTGSDPARAREMCVLLSDFLRTSLGVGDRPSIPLRQELELARNFLAIQTVRFSRLQTEEQIEGGLQSWPVPPLILQPLVENAITHGIATLVEGGTVRMEARRAGDLLEVAVENTFDPEAPRRRRASGIGLANVRKRLDARYGHTARVDVRVDGNRFRVELTIPAEEEK